MRVPADHLIGDQGKILCDFRGNAPSPMLINVWNSRLLEGENLATMAKTTGLGLRPPVTSWGVLLTEAQKNTEGMLTGMLTSLGFQHVTVTFGGLR